MFESCLRNYSSLFGLLFLLDYDSMTARASCPKIGCISEKLK